MIDIKTPVHVYGIFLTPEQIKELDKYHKTTYLEYEIPKKLERKLNKIIKEEIRLFKKQCNCPSCKPSKHKNK